MKHLKVVGSGDGERRDESALPFAEQARAVFERAMARKPIAMLVMYETEDGTFMECAPPISAVMTGLAHMAADILYEDKS